MCSLFIVELILGQIGAYIKVVLSNDWPHYGNKVNLEGGTNPGDVPAALGERALVMRRRSRNENEQQSKVTPGILSRLLRTGY